MAMNFSYDSSFQASSNKSPYGPFRPIDDGYLVKKYCCFDDSWGFCIFNEALEDNPCGELVNTNLDDKLDEPTTEVVDDILDRLPRDPFGMIMMKSSFPEISDCVQDFVLHSQSKDDAFWVDETHKKIDQKLFTGLYWGLNGVGSYPFGGNQKGNEMFLSYGKVERFLPTSHGDSWVSGGEAKELKNSTKVDYDGVANSLHDAMPFMLDYLGLADLVSVDYLNLEAEVLQKQMSCWKKHAIFKHNVIYASPLRYRECPF